MRPPASESENRTHGAKKMGRVNTPTFSTELAMNGLMRCNKELRQPSPFTRSRLGILRPGAATHSRARRDLLFD